MPTKVFDPKSLTPDGKLLFNFIKDEFSKFETKLTKFETAFAAKIDNLIEEQGVINMRIDQLEKNSTELFKSCAEKDTKIAALEAKNLAMTEKVGYLLEKVDDEDAYIRRESLIFGGKSIPTDPSVNCAQTVVSLLRSKLQITIDPKDISVAHRLGQRKANQQGPDNRHIIAKFCRRDLKRDILGAARTKKPTELFVNESLTKLRQKIMRALRQAKREHPDVISGMNTIEGRVFVWRKTGSGRNDSRHCVNTLEKLEEFCMQNLGTSSTTFLVSRGPNQSQ